MANTYSQIYIQTVFAVQGRESLIKSEWREEFYKYITGIITNHDQKLLAIGGIENHIHILIGLKPNCEISKLIQEVKANSSKFVNQKRFVKGKFSWQEGFGASRILVRNWIRLFVIFKLKKDITQRNRLRMNTLSF